MSITTSRSARRYASWALVAACLALAGCGSSGSSNTKGSSSTPATSTPATTSTPASSGIPQGPNAGDKDSDNNGGPSDGDGNI